MIQTLPRFCVIACLFLLSGLFNNNLPGQTIDISFLSGNNTTFCPGDSIEILVEWDNFNITSDDILLDLSGPDGSFTVDLLTSLDVIEPSTVSGQQISKVRIDLGLPSGGTYFIRGSSRLGLALDDSIEVNVAERPWPGIMASEGNRLCPGQSINLVSIDSSAVYTYDWRQETSIGDTSLNINSTILPIGYAGVFTLNLSSSECLDVAGINIPDLAVPIITPDLNLDNLEPEYCQVDSMLPLGGSGLSGIWGGAATSNVFPLDTTPGIYNITYTEVGARYEVSQIPFVPYDRPSDILVSIPANGENFVVLDDLDFDFEFFGQSKDTLVILYNGILSFRPNAVSRADVSVPAGAIPFPGTDEDLIAAFWSSGYSSDEVYVGVSGIPGSKVLTVRFDSLTYSDYQQPFDDRWKRPVSFEVRLYEGSNDIEIQLIDCPVNGRVRSIGIEGDISSTDGEEIGYQFFRGESELIEKAVRFSPIETGCTISKSIEILETPEVRLVLDIDSVCSNSPAPLTLTGGSILSIGLPGRGGYVGIGVSNDSLYLASLVGQGIDSIGFFFEGDNGCSAIAYDEMNVIPPPSLTILPQDTCLNDSVGFFVEVSPEESVSLFGTLQNPNGEKVDLIASRAFLDTSGVWMYSLMGITSLGCVLDEEVSFSVKEPEEFSFTADSTTKSGRTVWFRADADSLREIAWIFPNGDILEGETVAYAFPDGGIQVVEIISVDSNFCVARKEHLIDVKLVPNPDSVSEGIYPNPNGGDFSIVINLLVEREVEATLFDLTGREIYKLNYGERIGRNTLCFEPNTHFFNVEGVDTKLSNGIYYLRVLVDGDLHVWNSRYTSAFINGIQNSSPYVKVFIDRQFR